MAARQVTVFVSSKMDEFRTERETLFDLLPTLPYGAIQLRGWVYEETVVASDHTIRDTYLNGLRKSDLYIGLFGKHYGQWTIDEFERASDWGIERLVFVSKGDKGKRDAQLQAFLSDRVEAVTSGVTTRWFEDSADLKLRIEEALSEWVRRYRRGPAGERMATFCRLASDVPDCPALFIGRAKLITEIQRMLNQNKRVLLQGFSGTGKTALAATIAARRIRGQRGPVLWLEAGRESAADVLSSLAKAFQVEQDITLKMGDEKSAAMHRLLRSQGVKLVVLDNVWAGDDREKLEEIAQAVPDDIPLLATSLERLSGMERILVDRLSRAEAVKLLNHYAHRGKKADTATRQLCELLNDNASLLKIAGRTLESSSLSPRELIDNLNLLKQDPERGRITRLLDWSYGALADDQAEAALQAFAGLYAPRITPALLSELLPCTPAQAVAALTLLFQRGLVNRQSEKVPLYRIAELTLDYARDKFPADADQRKRMVAACRSFVRKYRDDFDVLDREIENILGAAAASEADMTTLIEIIADLAGVTSEETFEGGYFDSRGHSTQSFKLLAAAIDAARKNSRPRELYFFLLDAGYAYNHAHRQFDAAEAAYQEAVQVAEQMGNVFLQVRALCGLGNTQMRADKADWNTNYEQAETLARSTNNRKGLAYVLQYRGNHALSADDYNAGLRFSREAADLAQAEGMNSVYFYALQNWGGCLLGMEQYKEALHIHETAHILADAQHNFRWEAEILWSLGQVHDFSGNKDAARRAYNKSLALWVQIGARALAAELVGMMQRSGHKIKKAHLKYIMEQES